MSFFYNPRCCNPVPYQAMGHWGGGYSLFGVDSAGYSTPYEADDFSDEDYEKAIKALGALKALLETPVAARNAMNSVPGIVPIGMDGVLKVAAEIEKSLAPVSAMIQAVPSIVKVDVNRSVAGNIFDVVGPTRDPDPTLYAIYLILYDMKEPEGEDGKVIIDLWKQIGQKTDSTHNYSSLSELSDALGELYDTYYDTYWDAEAAKTQATTGKTASPNPAPKTGKPRKIPTKAPMPTPRKTNKWLMYAAIGGGILGAVWLGMKLLKK